MPLELVPLVLAGLVGLVGLGLIADGWLPDSAPRIDERRRRARAERDCAGEVLIGLGLLAAAAALAGRDAWRWGTVAMIAAVVLLAAGAVRNRAFLAERVRNRGKARRGRRRERRVEAALERPVTLVVASAADRRSEDRRDHAEYRAPQPAPPLEPRVPATPDRPRGERRVVRRAVAD
jgi:hypothetical protein